MAPLSLGPRSVERPADTGWTLVGGIDDPRPARVDAGGLVAPAGADWAVDWWIGADDRWYLPAREPAVRQRRRGPGPIIETTVRVPSGDVVATAHPVVAAGRRAVVLEVTNASPVPVALALAVRPVPLDGGPPRRHRLELLDGTTITVDGHPAVILPRQPNERVADPSEDVVERVTGGEALSWTGPVEGSAANAAVLFPLPHTTSLRFTVVGPPLVVGSEVDPVPLAAGLAPEVLPPIERVVQGWSSVIDGAGGFRFPDSGLTDLVGAARARLVLASVGLGPGIVALDARSAHLLEALAVAGHDQACRPALVELANGFPRRLPPDTEAGPGAVAAARVLHAVALAVELQETELAEALLAPVAQVTSLVERKRRAPVDAVATAKLALARVAARAGQLEAADHLRSTIDRGSPAGPAGAVAASMSFDEVAGLAEQAGPTGAWPPGDGAGAAARFLRGACGLLLDRSAAGSEGAVGDGRPVVDLLPAMPTAWLGGEVEVSRAPVAGVRVSYAIRWHGYRPALLWQVDPAIDGDGPDPVWPLLRCPGLDPDWSSAERSGETLLTGSADALPPAPEPGDSFA